MSENQLGSKLQLCVNQVCVCVCVLGGVEGVLPLLVLIDMQLSGA
jgi:hypothetical protein